uniref:AAA+ ATPase domain-containing protein n=1 Tax=Aureoumbra lagunensis TaxID=44058 RepID=A0A7S3NHN1_9STRA|mmetsp:Transcript_17622/g.22984  ORF Transcript_17622/g.22984 Transcript_17622/m.22984 type:complete len:702 (+) Transcript_17622:76-2181(+)
MTGVQQQPEKLVYLIKKLVSNGEISLSDGPSVVVSTLTQRHQEYARKSQPALREAVREALAMARGETSEEISLNASQREAYAVARRSSSGARKGRNTDDPEETIVQCARRAVPSQYINEVLGAEDAVQLALESIVEPMRHAALYSELGIQGPRAVLIHGPTGCGKTLLARAVSREACVDEKCAYFEVNGAELACCGDAEKVTQRVFQLVVASTPALLFIDDLDALFGASSGSSSNRALEISGRRFASTLCGCLDAIGPEQRISIIGATASADSLDSRLRRFGRFEREIALGAPNAKDRAAMLAAFLAKLKKPPLQNEIDPRVLAKATPGWVGADLAALVAEAGACAVRRRVKEMKNDNTDWRIMSCDLEIARTRVCPSFSRTGFAASPGVAWTDVGALAEAREQLAASILAPIASPEKFAALGVPLPAGVLLYGPPGCGKTLLARAVASESSANFISIKGPELLDKYVGESERAVRNLFARARSSAPCIVFFDEIDALCPRRAGSAISGASATASDGSNAVTDRVVNQLLTELDGLESRGQVYVVAATNRPELLDPALTRPGRIDKLLFVPLPTESDRISILIALTQNKVRLAQDVDFSLIAADPRAVGFSGADLAALVREAGLAALQDNDGTTTCVSALHFDLALDRVPPSVSPADAQAYTNLALRMNRSKKRATHPSSSALLESSSPKKRTKISEAESE